ncbi:TraV family lipoprotein [Thiorhodococcus mannitoliphagus]|uniref:TraV family lipoprotein n=1 Tax=Thiorhodococcus mannitoliphagus TaxID=329406 RepID=A0A6P1DY35_9GAMM|nr:TraV family lipoprotein [Thiorhodococcus mannitoliphagus]NEX23227.1 TraV family lipoprotein [Thiorhodococcus mannitoliphagus]
MTKEPTLPFDPARSGLLLLLLGVSLVTSGCGSLAVGEKRFGCKGHPSDPLCLPASRVYDLTNGTDSLQPPDWESERVDGEASGAQPARRVAVSVHRRDSSGGFFGDDAALFGATRNPANASAAPDVAPVDEPVEALPIAADEDLLLPRSRDPIPLRVPAQVMRIWLAPWEDENADLHASGYVFTEIAPRTWSLAAGPDRFSNALLKPLQVEQRVVSGGGDSSAPPRRQPTCAGDHCPSATGEPRRSLN